MTFPKKLCWLSVLVIVNKNLDPLFIVWSICTNIWTWRTIRAHLEWMRWWAFFVQKYSLDHLKIADFASSLNGRLCSDQLNYIYWCIHFSLITLLGRGCVCAWVCLSVHFLPNHSEALSSLDIGVCGVGLSFSGLCDSVFVRCVSRCHRKGEWIPLGG